MFFFFIRMSLINRKFPIFVITNHELAWLKTFLIYQAMQVRQHTRLQVELRLSKVQTIFQFPSDQLELLLAASRHMSGNMTIHMTRSVHTVFGNWTVQWLVMSNVVNVWNMWSVFPYLVKTSPSQHEHHLSLLYDGEALILKCVEGDGLRSQLIRISAPTSRVAKTDGSVITDRIWDLLLLIGISWNWDGVRYRSNWEILTRLMKIPKCSWLCSKMQKSEKQGPL